MIGRKVSLFFISFLVSTCPLSSWVRSSTNLEGAFTTSPLHQYFPRTYNLQPAVFKSYRRAYLPFAPLPSLNTVAYARKSDLGFPCAALEMAPSTYDQKKSTIVKLAEKECFAETETAKAIYELACLEVKEKYKAKKEEACRDLRQQELKELDEITRLHEAKMEPIKAQQEQKLAAIRKQYGIAVPEAGLQAPVSPSSNIGCENGHKKFHVLSMSAVS